MPLSFNIYNQGTDVLQQPELCVHTYQDNCSADDGVPCTDMGGRILWSGALTQLLPAIEPGRSAAHELQACFLAAGTYMVCVSCRLAATGAVCWSQSPLTIVVVDSHNS